MATKLEPGSKIQSPVGTLGTGWRCSIQVFKQPLTHPHIRSDLSEIESEYETGAHFYIVLLWCKFLL